MSDNENHIAIISMVCRLPGANDIDTYWKNLCDGVESISFFSEEETQSCGVSAEMLQNPNYVRAGGIIDKAEEFDPSLFSLSPREATLTDPQHRLLLECGWEGLEKAGYNPRDYDGLIGVFVGSGASSYLINNIIPSRYWNDTDARYEIQFENFFGYLSPRLSYKLHLQGPSISLQTSCSTSLVATHMACQSLLNYECDLALAGGSSIQSPQQKGYLHQPESILSPDGHCRVFDSKAAGTVFSNGVGLVVLKRLQDAIDDGDNIDAVILGSAINNDGGRKLGFTAPSAQGQAEVIATAQAIADVEPEDVRYIETHGTGTLLGDPIEVSGLKKVFKVDNENHCALGSVKANIGHTDAAAGMAGLIKAALTVKHGMIPPSINYDSPNPALGIEGSPFYINIECVDWPEGEGSRIAGVGSFGMGGTNAHAIVQQPPVPETGQALEGPALVVLSAANEKSLQQIESNLEKYLQSSSHTSIKDIAYTLQLGRVALSYRRAFVCRDSDDLLAKLRGEVNNDSINGKASNTDTSVAFMFTGQGSQYINMGLGLYNSDQVFHTVFDQCAAILQDHLGQDIRTLLFVNENEKEAAQKLSQTATTQPLLFAFEYALAKTWMAWGIQPASFIGHSIGEYVAACLAGVLSLEDALLIVSERGRLIQSLPGGTMMAVSLPEVQLVSWLNDSVSLAAVNAPESCVVSGETAAIDKLAEELDKKGINYTKLHTSHAFHSYMMDPVLDSFRQKIQGIQLNKPRIPFISNVSGRWITDDEATSPDYWVRHIREAVRFSDGIQCLSDATKGFLLEVGPGNTLCSLSRSHSMNNDIKILGSTRHPRELVEDEVFIYRTLSTLWVSGCDVKWRALPDAEKCRRVCLPTYPFDRKRYWVEPGQQPATTESAIVKGKLNDIGKWFYQTSWIRTPYTHSRALASSSQKTWVILGYEGKITEALEKQLAIHDEMVITILAGKEFKQDGNSFVIDPSQFEHYQQVLSYLSNKSSQFQFVHALKLTAPSNQQHDEALTNSFFSLLNLVQALSEQKSMIDATNEVVLNVLTLGADDVLGNEQIDPDSSLAVGLSKVSGQEYPNCFTRYFDLSIEDVAQADTGWMKPLIKDLHANIDARCIAYRNQQRWQPEFQALDVSSCSPSILREQGLYMITGGLGNVGLTIAEYLATKVSARLILLSRSEFPARDEWDSLIAKAEDSTLVNRLQMLRKVEKAGGVVHIKRADVSNINEMTELMESVTKEHGTLNGVVHAAGIVGETTFKPVPEIKYQDFKIQYAPKVEGVKVLQQVIDNTDIDFCMLVSSLAVQLGGLGSAVYTASNRYMDAFAQKMQRDGSPWFSINWDTWQFESQLSTGSKIEGSALSTYNFTPDEGMCVLEKLFSIGATLPALAVSTGDLTERYRQNVLHTPEEIQQSTAEPVTQTEKTASNAENNDSSLNETEKILVEIWQDLLGLDSVSVHDSFFDVGGDSLKGLRLTSRIRKQLDVELSINDLFKMPTISELASSFSVPEAPIENNTDGADKLREQIDQMTPEQISALLEKKRKESKQ